MKTDVPSPYGLGWTRKLALLNAPDASVQEMFVRQLFIGLGIATVAFMTIGSVMTLFLDLDLETKLIWSGAGLIPVLVCFAIVAVFIVRGQNVAPYAHLLFLTMFPIGMFGGLTSGGGMSVWTNAAWGFTYILVMAMLDGVRGALAWTGLTIVGWFALAAIDTRYGFSNSPPVVPMFDDPYAQAWNFAGVALFGTLLLTWFVQQRKIVEELLVDERHKAEALLRNVLPDAVIARVQRGELVADQQEEVTVIFADLVGFTTLAAGIPARRVVEMLAEIFGEIDRIAAEEGIEKVKTIGDCYMAVAGAPTPCRDHPDRAMRFATRVRDSVNGRTYYGTEVSVRIGLHSGPVVAGIIGNQRLLWDLWGDTVNTASRMESSGVQGEVQVSEATIRLCADKYDLDDRGVIQLKGRSGLRSFIVRRTANTKAATA